VSPASMRMAGNLAGACSTEWRQAQQQSCPRMLIFYSLAVSAMLLCMHHRRSANASAAEAAFWAAQREKRANTQREMTDQLALGKLDELARREDRVSSTRALPGCVAPRTEDSKLAATHFACAACMPALCRVVVTQLAPSSEGHCWYHGCPTMVHAGRGRRQRPRRQGRRRGGGG
jgi:hypothetical protein